MGNLMVEILRDYPSNKRIKHCANKLKNGINPNSPKDLENISSLSYWLYILENNVDLALKVNKIVNDEIFDGNYNKWTWLESIYQLNAYLLTGDEQDFYIKKLKSPSDILDDEKKVNLYHKTVERRLNDKNLNFKEIQTAMEKKDIDSEINWRKGQILKLIFISMYGNSQVYSFEDLKAMIDENISTIKKIGTVSD
jgi:hypothetical protein